MPTSTPILGTSTPRLFLSQPDNGLKNNSSVSGSTSAVAKVTDNVTSFGKTAGSGFVAFAELVCGLGCTFLGISAEYLLKDSWLDRASKLFSIGGLAIAGVGFWNAVKLFKGKNENSVVQEQGGIRVNDDGSFEKKCKELEGRVKSLDPNFFESFDVNKKSLIRSREDLRNTDLNTVAGELLLQYSDELVKTIGVYVGSNPTITSVNGSPKLSEFKNRFAELLSYCVSSYDSQSDAVKKRIGEILLGGKVSEKYSSVLPLDFVSAYEAGKYYKKAHESKNKSLETVIGGDKEKKLIEGLTKAGGEPYDKGLKYLTELQTTYNNLLGLDSLMNFVLDPKNQTDSKNARYVGVLKGALIASFDLKGKTNIEVDKELRNILYGVKNSDTDFTVGIKGKLEALKERIEALSQNFSKEEFPFERKPYYEKQIEFLKNITFYEIKERP